MATYSTVEEVKSEFKDLVTSGDTAIDDEEIDAFRADAFSYINARIGNKYQTPVPDTAECINILKQIEIWFVKDRIESIVRRNLPAGKKVGSLAGSLKKDAEDLLDKIISGKMRMGGATLRTSADGVKSFAVANGEAHQVKKGTDQW